LSRRATIMTFIGSLFVQPDRLGLDYLRGPSLMRITASFGMSLAAPINPASDAGDEARERTARFDGFAPMAGRRQSGVAGR
jgi:hypothetical protein